MACSVAAKFILTPRSTSLTYGHAPPPPFSRPISKLPAVVLCRSSGRDSEERKPVAEASPSFTSLQEGNDSSTKQALSGSGIERRQAEASSKQQCRPETGNRSLGSLFAFDGPAPEAINGRMAMVGFVWAAVAEKMTGLTVMEQLFNPATSGLLWFAVVVQLFTVASIIPLANGGSTDGRRWGPFDARAETWNGRLAMIGFAALVIDEMIRQAPFVH